MLLTVSSFVQRVEYDLNGLIDDLRELTGRYGEWELKSWQRSLPELSRVLSQTSLQDFHVHLGQSGGMALEYRLPASSSWCDAVLLGATANGPSAVVVEMKDWDTTGDRPGPRAGLIEHKGALHLHPSEQVRAYVEYCRRFHGAVVDQGATVSGCVFFTNRADLGPYIAAPHDMLVADYPVFNQQDIIVTHRLPGFLAQQLAWPSQAFAEAFAAGEYVQDRNFVIQVAKSIQESQETAFVLLDEQRKGFELCMSTIERVMAGGASANKAVIIVEGPPGSGKSVLAAQLWAALARGGQLDGPVVLTTTSGSQRSNWEHLFAQVAGGPAGKGVVMPANRYNPGLSPAWVKEQRSQGHALEIGTWRDNVRHYLAATGRNRMPDNHLALSIVDEAHALIDPTAPGAQGVPPSGWSMHAGPQVWHIIRASRVSIFLLDGDQSYRDNETTTSAAIERFAHEQGIATVERISLADAQFRCGGSAEYVEWLAGMLGLSESSVPASAWRRRDGGGAFTFEIVNDPAALDEVLGQQMLQGRSGRLVAAYGRKWKSKEVFRPHDLPPEQQDFQISYRRDDETREWLRPWNYAPGQDYTLFIQAPEGSRMHENALAEVGCPYVVRGFDYDYLGVLWLGDLVWRDGRWRANLGSIYESAWPRTIKAARDDPDGPGMNRLVDRLARGYRILLTRAIRGVYVWFEDEETRRHVEAWLGRRR